MQGSGRTVTSNILPPELEKYRAAVESLSDRQRECLALVARGMISKRIGPKLGIMPGTVDKHVDKARVALNGMSRADAAQIVLAFETGREIQFVDTYFLPPPPRSRERQLSLLITKRMGIRMMMGSLLRNREAIRSNASQPPSSTGSRSAQAGDRVMT